MTESKGTSAPQIGNLSVPSFTRFQTYPGVFQVTTLSCDNPHCLL
ncbi:hypothetical protein WDW89_04595 [Deltaproteobacteria bacterium TL4]